MSKERFNKIFIEKVLCNDGYYGSRGNKFQKDILSFEI